MTLIIRTYSDAPRSAALRRVYRRRRDQLRYRMIAMRAAGEPGYGRLAEEEARYTVALARYPLEAVRREHVRPDPHRNGHPDGVHVGQLCAASWPGSAESPETVDFLR